MSRTARMTAAPVPMGFKFDPEKSLGENARAAWDVKRGISRPQAEHNARVQLRHIFGKDNVPDDLVFQYQEQVTFERPIAQIDDELIIWMSERKELALLEYCSECGKTPAYRSFHSLAGYGQALTERDDAEPHVCSQCKVASALNKKAA